MGKELHAPALVEVMTSTKYIPVTKENLREEMLTFFFSYSR